MKNYIQIFALALLFAACAEAPKNTSETSAASVSADSAMVAQVIHGFYTWYDAISINDAEWSNFTDNSGKHLKLDTTKFNTFLNHLKSSGFVSQSFLDQEKAFYKKCELLWQNEPVDEVPSGMDADKYFCAQDWEINFWVNSPVRIKPLGQYKLAATMYGDEGGSPREHNFELVKENGKWLLSSIECDMGVQ